MKERISTADIQGMNRIRRINFVNTLSGFKPAMLIGTKSHRGAANLAMFNSVIHVSANPPMLGFLIRPLTVPRHTYHNIKAQGSFTINHVHEGMLRQAHQTSANYSEGVSEFEACGLTPDYSEVLAAPYVRESRIKLGLEYVEEQWIRANETILIVGKIVELFLPEGAVQDSGHIDLEVHGTVAVAGLDTYGQVNRLTRLDYARPGKELRELK